MGPFLALCLYKLGTPCQQHPVHLKRGNPKGGGCKALEARGLWEKKEEKNESKAITVGKC